MNCGVYQIRNTANGKIYVGSSVNIAARWRKHHLELMAGKHGNQKLQRAWIKYGAEAFLFSVLELVEKRADVLTVEQKWIDALNACGENGYNILPKAGSHLGAKRTPEAVAKLREINRGRYPSEETREKMRAAKVGRKLSEEHRAKIGAAHVGRKTPAEVIAKRVAKAIGRPMSPEAVENSKRANRARLNTLAAYMTVKSNSKSGYPGVSWCAAVNKWRARFGRDRKELFVIYHDDPAEASAARLKFIQEYLERSK